MGIILVYLCLAYTSAQTSHAQLRQPNGSIIPASNALSNFLNNAPLNENIDVINEASLVPEVFTPSDTLTFSFVAEGGGYENAFGWYNLGDDVTQPENRFIIFDCFVEPRTPFETSTVTFCGNPQWKGGPIGFFLITPQRRDGQGGRRPNCALNDNVGYIYYSEPRLNRDEDPNSTFIHHLVYRSNSFPNAFYFGFEDLFRGGDNDFEDALILIEGLLVGDVPEVCDGADDDCDGRIDEGAEESCSTICGQGVQLCSEGQLDVCSAPDPTQESCDGIDNDCDGLLDEGVTRVCNYGCGAGLEVCLAGEWSICTAQTPQDERCNNVDEDCDGNVDEGLSVSCANGCGVEGLRMCIAGSYGQCDAPLPETERCDNRDNDCDGQIDEAIVQPCESSCGVGLERCDQGGFVACDAPTPEGERCDGNDNDCDGQIDESLSRECSSICGGVGVEQCLGGLWIGCSAPQPRPESCNQLDDDCDGQIDEALIQECSNACGTGSQSCLGGSWSACDAILPELEVCDGFDQDCDGQVDEEIVRSCQAICGIGTQICILGDFTACNVPPPQEEICDDLDNDCDGLVDESLEKSCDSLCGLGNEICIGGTWTDCTAPEPKSETCNAIDDDCDGLIDEALVRRCDNPCGEGMSRCELGRWSDCPATSATEERCDSADNDCDGLSDENVVCPEARAVCIRGECALPCLSGECSIGQECVEGVCLNVPCQSCRSYEVCENDRCLDLCSSVSCDEGSYCSQGECILGDCYPIGCESGKICIEGQCQPDDCDLVSCSLGQGCIEGRCFPTCAQTNCAVGERCVRGECLPDTCDRVSCGEGEYCQEGGCIRDLCDDVLCQPGRVCRNAECVNDPCLSVHCPNETECVVDRTEMIDCIPIQMEVSDDGPTSNEGAGEEVSLGGDMSGDRSIEEERAESISGGCQQKNTRSPIWLWSLTLLWFFSRRQGRWQSGQCFKKWTVLMPLFLSVSLVACDNHESESGDEAGDSSNAGSSFLINGCAPKIESCNGLDDDCDGDIDNVSNLDRDPENCGQCGNRCDYEQGEAICVNAVCRLARCLPGYANADGQSSNGCESTCTVNSEVPEGVDLCNQRDDDCDGVIDEGYNLGQDPDHCGGCGVACYVQGVAEATCISGRCVISECEAGYINLDGEATNGCEYGCTGAEAVEVCNGTDDDCDGRVDEELRIDIDCLNQGLCVGVSPACRGEDGVICAYPETVNLNGEVRCDGRDEDCDGLVDEEFLGLGEPCDGDDADQCFNGILTCSSDRSAVVCQERTQQYERCDGVDNDCDQIIDEDFLLLFDVMHCGECGQACSMIHAESACRDGRCLILSCEEGYQNLDENVDNGCEYACTPSGEERCDGEDNDCDGRIDETLTLTDTIPCLQQGVCSGSTVVCLGEAGFICAYSDDYEEGQETLCDNRDNDCDGVIDETFSDLGMLCDGDDQDLCLGGVIRCNTDQDGLTATVCSDDLETITERCDGVDNDCDQSTDEDFNLLSDIANCGRCALSCVRDTAQTRCQQGLCEIVTCSQNRYDLNQLSFDGCEYECIANPDLTELCNGVDDDCDGNIDEEVVPPLGLNCDGPGVCQGVLPTCKADQGFVCERPEEVYQLIETRCDQLDNDCDGLVDESGDQPTLANLGELCGDGVGACARQGVFICGGDQRSTQCSANAVLPEIELCNGIDDDCDGRLDEEVEIESEMTFIDQNGDRFWIDKWEASRPDASPVSRGLNVSWACSKANVLPWANLSLTEAQVACEARGKRLCSDEEWQLACGAIYPYGNSYDPSACVTDAQFAEPTGSRAQCESNVGVFDMSGNLAEWTTCARSQDCQIVSPQLGGSYADRISDIWRCDFRGNAVPNISTATAGFRCCADP
jgi:Notch 1